MNAIIPEPFKTAIDVTPETPVNEIPESYYKTIKPKFIAEGAKIEALRIGLEELSNNQDIELFIISELNHVISNYDNHIIRAVFYAGLSMYGSPLNLALRCESGSGKSYGTTQTVAYLPPENVLYVGSQSPKVISHENGICKTPDGRNFDDIPEPQKPDKSDEPNASVYRQLMDNFKEDVKAYRKLKDECYYEVDLRNRLIVFLESVNPETFKMFKATMSHDNDWIDHKFVDDKGKVHITRLIGAPALIFNSLDTDYLEEFSTRCLTATPNTTPEKIKASKKISTVKSNYPWKYNGDRFNKKLIQEYLRKIRDTMVKGKIKAVNPFENTDELTPSSQVRDMRDYNKFLELMPSLAYVHLFQRPIMTIHGQRYVLPTIQDALEAKSIFDSIEETTKTGTEQRIISFYWDVVVKTEGAPLEDITSRYNHDRKRKLSSTRIREWLDRLVQIEWVDPRQDEHENSKGYIDRRVITYHPLKQRDDGTILGFGVDLKPKLEEGYALWLKTVTTENGFTPEIIIPRIDGAAYQITLEDMEQLILGTVLI